MQLYRIFRYSFPPLIHYVIIFKYNHVVDYGTNIVMKDSIQLQQEQKFEHHLVCELLFSMRFYAQNLYKTDMFVCPVSDSITCFPK
jgi:hypothetical protein